MHTNDRGEPWPPHLASSRPKPYIHISSVVPIQSVMIPSKQFYWYTVECFLAQQLADKWNDIVSNTESRRAAIVDVHSWLAKATLDVYVPGRGSVSLIFLIDLQMAESGQVRLNM